jgi:hypothetical protein
LPDSKPITSFRLPDGKTIEAFAVKLKNGQTVVRTAEELERAPAPPSPGTINDPRR